MSFLYLYKELGLHNCSNTTKGLRKRSSWISAKSYAYDSSPYAYTMPHTRTSRGECLTFFFCYFPYAYHPHHTRMDKDHFPHKTPSSSCIRVPPPGRTRITCQPTSKWDRAAYTTRIAPWVVPHTRMSLFHTRMDSNQTNFSATDMTVHGFPNSFIQFTHSTTNLQQMTQYNIHTFIYF